MRDEDVVDLSIPSFELLSESVKIQVAEFLVGSIHQRCFLLPKDEKAVVSCSILKPARPFVRKCSNKAREPGST